jgi:hypothetical protein
MKANPNNLPSMNLVSAEEFARSEFSRPPDLRTIRSWISRGDIPGRKIGCRYYVDLAAFRTSTGNKLADRLERIQQCVDSALPAGELIRTRARRAA